MNIRSEINIESCQLFATHCISVDRLSSKNCDIVCSKTEEYYKFHLLCRNECSEVFYFLPHSTELL